MSIHDQDVRVRQLLDRTLGDDAQELSADCMALTDLAYEQGHKVKEARAALHEAQSKYNQAIADLDVIEVRLDNKTKARDELVHAIAIRTRVR